MARSNSSSRIIHRTSRARLSIRREPYWHLIAEGKHLGYRKGARGGTWIARFNNLAGQRRLKSIGPADDTVEADGVEVFNFQQAQEIARDWFKQATQVTPDPAAPYTVAQVMKDYITESERIKRQPLKRTRTAIEAHILGPLGDIDVNKLTHATLKAWRDALQDAAPRVRTKAGRPQAFREIDKSDEDAKRKRQASANRVFNILKAALNYVHTHDSQRVSSNAAWARIKPFRNVDVPKIRFLEPAEANALAKGCDPAPDFRLLVQGALLTGARYGELKAMKVSAFDRKQESVFIPKSKNGDARHVLLNAEAVRFFSQITAGKTAKEHIFLRFNKEKKVMEPWEDSEQGRYMNEACKLSNLHGVNFHILRHTYASMLVMNDASMRFIADQLGHKSIKTTEQYYAHLATRYKLQTIRRTLPDFGFEVTPVTTPAQTDAA